MKILTIIPARGGSKGLPGKNIKNLFGKPLIAWSIEQGLSSKYVNEVIVSTDSKEIADIAIKFGARVPFMRPDYLATDTSSTVDVLLYTIDELRKMGEVYDYILLLEPTSPLREGTDIDQAIETLVKNDYATSVVGISKVESQHPAFCISLSNEGFLQSKNNFQVLRRQDIEELYYYEGSIYFSEMSTYIDKKNFYHEKTIGLEMPKWKAFEIDDEVDFLIVEALLEKYYKKNKK